MIDITLKPGIHDIPSAGISGKHKGEPDLSRLLARMQSDFGAQLVGYLGIDDEEAYTIIMSLEHGTATSADIGPKRPYTIEASGYRHHQFLSAGGKLTAAKQKDYRSRVKSAAKKNPTGSAATSGMLPRVLEIFYKGKWIYVPYVRIVKGIRPRHFIQKSAKEAIRFFETKAKAVLGDIRSYKRYPQGVVAQVMTETLDYTVQRIVAHMGPRQKKWAKHIVVVPPAVGGESTPRRRVSWSQ